MSYEFEPDDYQPPKSQRKHGCLGILIILIIVVSLIGASAIGIISFYRESLEAQARTAELSKARLDSTPEPTPDQPAVSSAAEIRDSATQPLPPTLTPGTAGNHVNRIVLVNEDGRIETIAPDGSQNRFLTGEELSYDFPAWSPDGRYIAALGSRRGGSGVFLLEDRAEPSEPQELYFSQNRGPIYLYWSPDSSQLSFLVNYPGQGLGLNLLDITGSEDSRIIASGAPLYWNWTADSRQMLIHSGATIDDRLLALIDDQGDPQGREIPAPGFFQVPGISASGRYWAYSQIKGEGNRYLVIDDKETGRQISERHAGSVALGWSPVTDQLAFISSEDSDRISFWGPLRLLDAQSGEMRLLSSNLVIAFFWSPDGQKIATISLPFADRFQQEIEAQSPKTPRLAKTSSSPTPVQFGPQNLILSIIDVSSGEGLKLTDFTPSTLFFSQFLVYFDQYALSHSVWSPSSDALVLPMVNEGLSQIMVISATSGRKNAISNGRIAFWSRQ